MQEESFTKQTQVAAPRRQRHQRGEMTTQSWQGKREVGNISSRQFKADWLRKWRQSHMTRGGEVTLHLLLYTSSFVEGT